jgi:hypothetical protein
MGSIGDKIKECAVELKYVCDDIRDNEPDSPVKEYAISADHTLTQILESEPKIKHINILLKIHNKFIRIIKASSDIPDAFKRLYDTSLKYSEQLLVDLLDYLDRKRTQSRTRGGSRRLRLTRRY